MGQGPRRGWARKRQDVAPGIGGPRPKMATGTLSALLLLSFFL